MHYLYRVHPTRKGLLEQSTPEEDAVVDEHFRYLKQLTVQGIVLMAGRTLNTDETSHGIVIFDADSEVHARAIMERDPAVTAGIFSAELFPFRIALTGKQNAPSRRSG